MALVLWVSDTEKEFIYDYDDNIAKDVKDDVRILVDKGEIKLIVKRGGNVIAEALIEPPKKPWDAGGIDEFKNVIFQYQKKIEQ